MIIPAPAPLIPKSITREALDELPEELLIPLVTVALVFVVTVICAGNTLNESDPVADADADALENVTLAAVEEGKVFEPVTTGISAEENVPEIV